MNSDFALAVNLILVIATDPERTFTSVLLSKLLNNVHPVRIRKTLSLLAKNGIIASKEGVNGGFTIKCDLAKVTLNDIYNLTQKDLLKPKCHECNKSCKVGSNMQRVLNDIFSGADDNLKQYLDGYTLKKVLNRIV